jgi:SNF2-related domain
MNKNHFLMKIGTCKIKKEDLFFYPTLDDEQYHEKINSVKDKCIFAERDSNIKGDDSDNKKFKLMKHQEEIPYLFNLFSFSKSIMLLCEMGSGKTILSIKIIENMKSILKDHNTKALILVPNHLIENVFYSEILGKVNGKYEKRVTGNSYVTKEMREMLNSGKDLEKKAMKRVKEMYELCTHKKWEQYVLNLSDDEIISEFSNRIIVVDEIHKAKSSESNLYRALEKVLSLAQNSWFIALNADKHLIDNPRELCQYINLLHLNNDKQIGEKHFTNDDIDKLDSLNEDVNSKAHKKLKEAVRGLFVFAIGHDSELFPNRIDVGYTQSQINNEFKNNIAYNEVNITSYNEDNITTKKKKTLPHNDVIPRHTHDDNYDVIYLRPVRMRGKQLEAYVNSFISEIISSKDLSQNEMWGQSRKHCRALLINDSKTILSALFDDIYYDSVTINGVIVVYCFFVEEGMYWFEKYLKSKGVKPFKGDEEQDPNCDYYFNFARPYSKTCLAKAIDICKNHSNSDGKKIKWILGTKKIGIGITISNAARVCSIGGEWNNYNQDQFFGRCIRIGSHLKKKSDIEIVKYCSVISKDDLDDINPLLRAQFQQFIRSNYSLLLDKGFIDKDTNHFKTIDEYMYDIVWNKYLKNRKMELDTRKNAMAVYDLSKKNLKFEGTILNGNESIKQLFVKQPIWNLKEMCKELDLNISKTKSFFIKLSKYIDNRKSFVAWMGKSGYISYIGNSYYQFITDEIDSLDNTTISSRLQDYIKPVKFLDSLFPMGNDEMDEYWIPKTLPKNMFTVDSDLHLKLNSKFPIAGTYSNTSSSPNCYQFKIVTNTTESVCSDKSIPEINTIAKKLNIVIPEFKNRKCRQQMVDSLLEQMKDGNLMLPWSPKRRPTLFQIYYLSKHWNLTIIEKKLRKLHNMWVKEDWVSFMIDVLKFQGLWENTDESSKMDIVNMIMHNLKTRKIYLFNLLNQTNCDRPKRFEKKCWNDVIKPFKKKIHNKYSNEIKEIHAIIKKELDSKLYS